MSNFSELVAKRRSVRKYAPGSLAPEEVELIMRAALMSPSSKRSTPWQFVLVENQETLKKLSYCKSSGASFLADCALAIVILTNPLQSGACIEDSSIAATMIQLQAEDLDLGSCWVQIRGRETETGEDSEDYVRTLLDIPLQLTIGCIIAIGKKEKPGKLFDESRLQWEKIHIGKYKFPEYDETDTES